MTWLDWVILVWVFVFALHGLIRGSVAQFFGVIGFASGAWTLLWVARWVGGYWEGAQPGWVYALLKWIVSALAGLAVAALFQWWGDGLSQAAKSGPLGWVDRGLGFAIGAAVGLGGAALALMMLFLVIPGAGAARSRAAAPLMTEASRACSLSVRYVPEAVWLEERFRLARDRAVQASSRPGSRPSPRS